MHVTYWMEKIIYIFHMVATKRQELWCSLQEISSEEHIQDLRIAAELT